MDHRDIWAQGERSLANKQDRMLTAPPVAREMQVRVKETAGLPPVGMARDTNDKQTLITVWRKEDLHPFLAETHEFVQTCGEIAWPSLERF